MSEQQGSFWDNIPGVREFREIAHLTPEGKRKRARRYSFTAPETQKAMRKNKSPKRKARTEDLEYLQR